MIYAINYDLKRPGQNYDKLYDAIRSCGEWWHYLGSTWLVDTPLSATAIWERLAPHVDKNDLVLVIGVTRNYSGWLPKDAWEWLNSRITKMAAWGRQGMRVQGAVIREQGQTFAIVIVKPHVVQNSVMAADAIQSFTPVFGVPVVLMAQDGRGQPTFYGRRDIARFLSEVPLGAIPWREYAIN